MAKSINRTFGVIGLGNFGSTVATELQRFGNHVIGIDINEARVSLHAENLSQAMIFDARDDAALRDVGLCCCPRCHRLGSGSQHIVVHEPQTDWRASGLGKGHNLDTPPHFEQTRR